MNQPWTTLALVLVLASIVLCMVRVKQFTDGFHDWRDKERSKRNNRNLLTSVMLFNLAMATFMAASGEWLWCFGLVGAAGIVWMQRAFDSLR